MGGRAAKTVFDFGDRAKPFKVAKRQSSKRGHRLNLSKFDLQKAICYATGKTSLYNDP